MSKRKWKVSVKWGVLFEGSFLSFSLPLLLGSPWATPSHWLEDILTARYTCGVCDVRRSPGLLTSFPWLLSCGS